MAKFDESKVIDALHPEKAEVGKKYYFNDSIYLLKCDVETDRAIAVGKLTSIANEKEPFQKNNECSWECLYPYTYEEPPEKLMTKRQFAEWLAKSCGEYSKETLSCCYSVYEYKRGNENDFIGEDMLIRPWDSEEWIKPTYKIYLRDCKGVTQDDIDDVAWRDGC